MFVLVSFYWPCWLNDNMQLTYYDQLCFFSKRRDFSRRRQTDCWFFATSLFSVASWRNETWRWKWNMNKNETFHFIQRISSEKDMCRSFAYSFVLAKVSGKCFHPCDVFLMKLKILSFVRVKTTRRRTAHYLFYSCGAHALYSEHNRHGNLNMVFRLFCTALGAEKMQN